jgi:hypothetical protein
MVAVAAMLVVGRGSAAATVEEVATVAAEVATMAGRGVCVCVLTWAPAREDLFAILGAFNPAAWISLA